MRFLDSRPVLWGLVGLLLFGAYVLWDSSHGTNPQSYFYTVVIAPDGAQTWSPPRVVGQEYSEPSHARPASQLEQGFSVLGECFVQSDGMMSVYDPATAYVYFSEVGDLHSARRAAFSEAQLLLAAFTGVFYEKPGMCRLEALQRRMFAHDAHENLDSAIQWFGIAEVTGAELRIELACAQEALQRTEGPKTERIRLLRLHIKMLELYEQGRFDDLLRLTIEHGETI